jgi:hypothetical protein
MSIDSSTASKQRQFRKWFAKRPSRSHCSDARHRISQWLLRTNESNAGRCVVAPFSPPPYSTVQYSTVQCSAVWLCGCGVGWAGTTLRWAARCGVTWTAALAWSASMLAEMACEWHTNTLPHYAILLWWLAALRLRVVRSLSVWLSVWALPELSRCCACCGVPCRKLCREDGEIQTDE